MAGASEREHQARPQLLAVRRLAHRLAEVGDQRIGLPEPEPDPNELVDGRRPDLLQALDLGRRRRLAANLGDVRSAPQGERFRQQRGCVLRLGVGGGARLGDQREERARIDDVRPGLKAVAMTFRDDRRRIVDIRRAGFQPAPELEHVRLEGLHEVGWRVFAPERFDEPVRADGPVGLQRQDGEQDRLLGRQGHLAIANGEA